MLCQLGPGEVRGGRCSPAGASGGASSVFSGVGTGGAGGAVFRRVEPRPFFSELEPGPKLGPPSSAFLPFLFWRGGSPSKIDYREKSGTLILQPLKSGGPGKCGKL